MAFRKLTTGGITWQLRRPHDGNPASILADPDFWLRQQNSIIKQSSTVVVARIPATTNNSSLIIKRFRPRGFWDSVKNLFRCSRATREFNISNALEQAGISTAKAVAVGDRRRARFWLVESYVITEEITDALTLRDWLQDENNGKKCYRLVKVFAETLAHLHNAGFAHSDLNLANFLAQCPQSSACIWLIDLEGISRRRVATTRLARNLRRLNVRVHVPDLARLRFLKWFCAACEPQLSSRTLARQILAGQQEWEVRRFGQHRWKVRPHFLDAQIRALMANPQRNISSIKENHRGVVLLQIDGDPTAHVNAETIGFTEPPIHKRQKRFVLKFSTPPKKIRFG